MGEGRAVTTGEGYAKVGLRPADDLATEAERRAYMREAWRLYREGGPFRPLEPARVAADIMPDRVLYVSAWIMLTPGLLIHVREDDLGRPLVRPAMFEGDR